jgi:succinate dehydrogenase/fumarate reductase flavoprotein subunit
LYAAGVEVGGVSVGGYTSGLAAALVFGRVAAALAVRDIKIFTHERKLRKDS